jgi:hypothetical protein
MIIVEVLERLLAEEGWYLHRYEFLHVGSQDLFRARIRFPCRENLDVGCFNSDLMTAGAVFNRIKEVVCGM